LQRNNKAFARRLGILSLLMKKNPVGWMTYAQTAALFGRCPATIRKAVRLAGIVPYAPAGERGPKLLSLADRREIRRVLRDEIRKYERRGKGEQPAA
jgi:hypothetical protein